MNRGVVMKCPRGTYRENRAAPTAQLLCNKCPKGWTTAASASGLATDCNIVLPGFNGAAAQIGADLTACTQDTYSVGGATLPVTCTACPSGYKTRARLVDSDGSTMGWTSASACGELHDDNDLSLLSVCLSLSDPWCKAPKCRHCRTNATDATKTPLPTHLSTCCWQFRKFGLMGWHPQITLILTQWIPNTDHLNCYPISQRVVAVDVAICN
jgi:hypothetical protein